MNSSTISTILKNKDKIMEHGKVAVNKDVDSNIAASEKVLHMDVGSVPALSPIQLNAGFKRKLKSLWRLKEGTQQRKEDISFNATYGWFRWFKLESTSHNLKVSGKAVSADMVTAQ